VFLALLIGVGLLLAAWAFVVVLMIRAAVWILVVTLGLVAVSTRALVRWAATPR
jgi:hypothetical protein